MNSEYLDAKRKFEILRRRLQAMDAKELPDAEKHLEVVKKAVREKLHFEDFFREFSKFFSIGQNAKRHYVVVTMKKFGTPSELQGVAAELEHALSGLKQPKTVVITDELVSYCAERFMESTPRLRSESRKQKARVQIEAAVRESLAQFLN